MKYYYNRSINVKNAYFDYCEKTLNQSEKQVKEILNYEKHLFYESKSLLIFK